MSLVVVTSAMARNSDHGDLLLGGPGQMTCGQFNKLRAVEKDKAMAWALGYVSGMATSNAEEVRMDRQTSGAEREDVKPINERKLVAEIKQQCAQRPNVFFPLIVEWAATGNVSGSGILEVSK